MNRMMDLNEVLAQLRGDAPEQTEDSKANRLAVLVAGLDDDGDIPVEQIDDFVVASMENIEDNQHKQFMPVFIDIDTGKVKQTVSVPARELRQAFDVLSGRDGWSIQPRFARHVVQSAREFINENGVQE